MPTALETPIPSLKLDPFVHRDPTPTAGYATVTHYLPGETLTPLFAPNTTLSTSNIFPQQTPPPPQEAQP